MWKDVETSYWDNPTPFPLFGYTFHAGVGSHGSAVEKFKQIADVLNRKFLGDPSYSVLANQVDHQVASVTFSRNSVGVVKKDARWHFMDIDSVHDVEPSDSEVHSSQVAGVLFDKY